MLIAGSREGRVPARARRDGVWLWVAGHLSDQIESPGGVLALAWRAAKSSGSTAGISLLSATCESSPRLGGGYYGC